MGATINPNTTQSLGKIFTGVQELLQAAAGGGAQPAQQPAAPAAQAPVDQFQTAPGAGLAQGAAAPAAPAGGGDITSKIQQLVTALTSVVQMLTQLLGK